MRHILDMSRHEIWGIRPEEVTRLLTADEVVHIAILLGAFWTYDYEAAQKGRAGMHALLKSGLHSDGFFVSRIMLQTENILEIMARQMVMCLKKAGLSQVDWVAGIPDGATKLGERIASILEAKSAKMEKVDGRISLVTPINPGETLLLAEDFCTQGTGFKEAVAEVQRKSPCTLIAQYDPVIVNRGGLMEIVVEGVGSFKIVPVVERRIQDWDPAKGCKLCNLGSVAIKPKASDDNWHALSFSQK